MNEEEIRKAIQKNGMNYHMNLLLIEQKMVSSL